MDFDPAQLRALQVAVSEGSLDAAARALRVTPSAISQRLRALESMTGRVLLVRSRPVRATPSGEEVLRLARQVDLLTADTVRELGGPGTRPGGRPVTLPIAVNADSLATWVLPALAPLAGDCAFDLRREDQQHTSALLRDGTVMAAVTAEADPVPGCTSTRLGSMRYRPMATAAFAERWLADGPTALAAAPVVVFDRRDDLQHGWLRTRTGPSADPPQHFVPSSADYVAAVRLGLGWGMVPDLQRGPGDDRLVPLEPSSGIDVVLYWQQWKLRSPALDRVAAAVLAGARRDLR